MEPKLINPYKQVGRVHNEALNYIEAKLNEKQADAINQINAGSGEMIIDAAAEFASKKDSDMQGSGEGSKKSKIQFYFLLTDYWNNEIVKSKDVQQLITSEDQTIDYLCRKILVAEDSNEEYSLETIFSILEGDIDNWNAREELKKVPYIVVSVAQASNDYWGDIHNNRKDNTESVVSEMETKWKRILKKLKNALPLDIAKIVREDSKGAFTAGIYNVTKGDMSLWALILDTGIKAALSSAASVLFTRDDKVKNSAP